MYKRYLEYKEMYNKDKIKKELKDLEEIKYSAITDIGQAVYNANIALLKRLLEE